MTKVVQCHFSKENRFSTLEAGAREHDSFFYQVISSNIYRNIERLLSKSILVLQLQISFPLYSLYKINLTAILYSYCVNFPL